MAISLHTLPRQAAWVRTVGFIACSACVFCSDAVGALCRGRSWGEVIERGLCFEGERRLSPLSSAPSYSGLLTAAHLRQHPIVLVFSCTSPNIPVTGQRQSRSHVLENIAQTPAAWPDSVGDDAALNKGCASSVPSS